MKRTGGELFSLPEPPPKPFVDPEAERSFTSSEHPAAIVEAVTISRPAVKRGPQRLPSAVPSPSLASSQVQIPPSGSSRLSVDVPPELLRRAKFRALEQGRTVRELVIELLMQGLES